MMSSLFIGLILYSSIRIGENSGTGLNGFPFKNNIFSDDHFRADPEAGPETLKNLFFTIH